MRLPVLALVAVAAVIAATAPPARAGSPFYELTEAQKRKIVVPDIKALTYCIAREVVNDSDAVTYYRAGSFSGYVTRQLNRCPREMNALLELYESTYGDGEAEKFIRGPYLSDLPRAVLSVTRPQLDAKVEVAKREEDVERQAQANRDAARQKDEDARVQAQIGAAALMEAGKQRFIAKPLIEGTPKPNLSVAFKRDSTPDSGSAFDLPPPASVMESKPKRSSMKNDLDEYATAHHTSSADIIRQTGMSAVDISDYIESGKQGGQTPDQVISGLLLMHVVSIDQNTSKVTSLGVSDMPKIVDIYNKNEMRFVRDFKGRHFDDDMAFANARQNLIISGSYSVIFGQGGFGGNLTCETSDPKLVNVIADWDKGDRIHVSGDITDVTFGNVQLISCTMQHR